MGLFGRWRRGERQRAGQPRKAVSADRQHLEEFVRTRVGVEAYVEPKTTVTETTVVLVATTGEWTRRRVPSPQVAHEWANALGVPSYDAAVQSRIRCGYPTTAARAAEQKQRRADGGSAAT